MNEQVNSDNSRVMGALTFLSFKLNTLHKRNTALKSLWCDQFTPQLLHHDNDVKVVSSQPNIQCMKVE